jgi:hypothetical protein
MTIAHVVIPPTHNAERINPDEFCIVESFRLPRGFSRPNLFKMKQFYQQSGTEQ